MVMIAAQCGMAPRVTCACACAFAIADDPNMRAARPGYASTGGTLVITVTTVSTLSSNQLAEHS
jgi:hypothetical protein